MALPRAKVKPAAPALEVAEAPERRATRAVLLKRVAAIVKLCGERECMKVSKKRDVNGRGMGKKKVSGQAKLPMK